MKLDRPKIRAELEEIQQASADNLLLVDEVIAFAKKPSTALHKALPWDDKKAAHICRRMIVRRLIREFKVVVTTHEPRIVHAYVSLTPHRSQGGGYMRTVDVLGREDLTAQMLADAHEEFTRFRRKYESLREFVPVFRAYDQQTAEVSAELATAGT